MLSKTTNSRLSTVFKEFQLLLVQGVHFYSPEAYFMTLAHNFCLLSWLTDPSLCSILRKTAIKSSPEERVSFTEAVLKTGSG
jgi:hypothetical protein